MVSTIAAVSEPIGGGVGTAPGMKHENPVVARLSVATPIDQLMQFIDQARSRLPVADRSKWLAFGVEHKLAVRASLWLPVVTRYHLH
jgi:hypothetical protein